MTLAEQLATLLEQGWDQPRHRADAAAELRRLRAEVDQLRAELTALREQKPVAYMVEYFGPDCGNPYAIYKADDMGCLRDKSQYTPLYVAPQPGEQQQPVAPDGWKLVPVEPTPEMLDAAARASMQHLIDCINDPAMADQVGSEEMCRLTHGSRYKSMLAAAPQAVAPATRGPTDNTLLATLLAVESAFAQKCADTWCTTSNLEVLETARAVITAAGGKVSRNPESER